MDRSVCVRRISSSRQLDTRPRRCLLRLGGRSSRFNLKGGVGRDGWLGLALDDLRDGLLAGPDRRRRLRRGTARHSKAGGRAPVITSGPAVAATHATTAEGIRPTGCGFLRTRSPADAREPSTVRRRNRQHVVSCLLTGAAGVRTGAAPRRPSPGQRSCAGVGTGFQLHAREGALRGHAR